MTGVRGQGGTPCLEAPEGDWIFRVERLPSLITFSPEYCTKIIAANLKRGVPGSYVIFNLRTSIFVYAAELSERDPLRRVDLSSGVGVGTATPSGYITTLSFAPDSPDEYDLLVGFSTGEIRALSLSAQLGSTPGNTRPISSLQFNSDGSLTSSRCVAAAWVRGGADGTFITVHAAGEVFLHRKIVGNSSDTRLLARTSSEAALHPAAATRALTPYGGIGARVAAAAVAPAGDRIALACRDGVLRILELPSGTLIGGFRSYYGGLLSCAWSPDGRLVAAGGEDDLVAVCAVEDRQMIAYLEGHMSWVSAVAFDGCWGGGEGAYRLASVGQDCRGILWELGGSELGSDAATSTERRDSVDGDVEMEDGGSGSDTGGGGGVGGGGVIAAALPRAEMAFVEPLAALRMHAEPLCDCVFLRDALLVTGADGSVKKFERPLREQL